MTERSKNVFFVFLFWTGAVLVGVFCWQLGVFKQSQVDEQRYRAIALRDMSGEWLKEVQMSDRISVKAVDLKKDKNDQLTFVKVTLDSSENYNLHYKEELRAYLEHRAQLETGVVFQFAFR